MAFQRDECGQEAQRDRPFHDRQSRQVDHQHMFNTIEQPVSGLDTYQHARYLYLRIDLLRMVIAPAGDARQLATVKLDDLDGSHGLHQAATGLRLCHDALLRQTPQQRGNTQPQRCLQYHEQQHYTCQHCVKVEHGKKCSQREDAIQNHGEEFLRKHLTNLAKGTKTGHQIPRMAPRKVVCRQAQHMVKDITCHLESELVRKMDLHHATHPAHSNACESEHSKTKRQHLQELTVCLRNAFVHNQLQIECAAYAGNLQQYRQYEQLHDGAAETGVAHEQVGQPRTLHLLPARECRQWQAFQRHAREMSACLLPGIAAQTCRWVMNPQRAARYRFQHDKVVHVPVQDGRCLQRGEVVYFQTQCACL